ncbi:translation initiation factor eIF-2B alpha subunit [Poronia punctata]|nr:translation initiation factor eIF-2B alpha subunit [Poronia punctata]
MADQDGRQQLPIRSNPDPDIESFDIVTTYHRLLSDDPDLTVPIATIEALIEALGASSATTAFETMKLVEAQSDRLAKSPSVANPMAVRHGSDFFKQYLVRELRKFPSGGGAGSGSASDDQDQQFVGIRNHLLRNARLFATRAKDAREKIAAAGRHLIEDESIVLTHGGSRVVGTLLSRAAERGVDGDARRRFKVVYAVSETRQAESNKIVSMLRAKGVPVATIAEGSVAHVMANVDLVLVGAEAITAQGGIISRLGTYQLAKLAQADNKPFCVAAELHKLGQTFPEDQFHFNCRQFKQRLLEFYTEKKPEDGLVQVGNPYYKGNPADDTEDEKKARETQSATPLDFTPPELIASFICDEGVLSTVAMEHKVIDMFVS